MDSFTAVLFLGLLTLGYATPLASVTQSPRTDEDVLREAVTEGFIVEQYHLTTQTRPSVMPKDSAPAEEREQTDKRSGRVLRQSESEDGSGDEDDEDEKSGTIVTTTTTTEGARTTTVSDSEESGSGESPTIEESLLNITMTTTEQTTTAATTESAIIGESGASEGSTTTTTEQTTTATTTEGGESPIIGGSSDESQTTTTEATTTTTEQAEFPIIIGSDSDVSKASEEPQTTTTEGTTKATPVILPMVPGKSRGLGIVPDTESESPTETKQSNATEGAVATTPMTQHSHQKDDTTTMKKGHVTPDWIIILGFLIGVAVLVLLCVAIATRDKWNRPNQFNNTGIVIEPTEQQRAVEMETFLHSEQPKENGKADEYTVIPLDELPHSYSGKDQY